MIRLEKIVISRFIISHVHICMQSFFSEALKLFTCISGTGKSKSIKSHTCLMRTEPQRLMVDSESEESRSLS